jgi:peptide-methionine (S)-S-oxide reductase
VEHALRRVPGVTAARSGYAGGHVERPTYQQVCTDRTGHAEAVEVEFDPTKVSYDDVLEAFWSLHDPTQMNRQGPDVGTQYRSAIFVHSDEQEIAARRSLARAQSRFRRPIATQIVPAEEFWPAEEYHQRYYEKMGVDPTCHIVP